MKLKCYTLSVSAICRLYRHGKLDLEPPYQRRPAWRTRQREDLLESIFNGIPIPAVIVYKTRAGRRTAVHEVMDGKQRLESILHFRYGRIIRGESKLSFWLRRDHSKQRKRLFYKDLAFDSPYNTYLHAGLPPTPIANPGLPSIQAALHPSSGHYLYYVARPDGRHIFSDTLEAHNRAVAEVRAMRRPTQ